jgi:hypothetical protein
VAAEGSDCVTGKRQYATRRAASAAASGLRSKGAFTYAFKCAWCGCFHIGNRRAWNSKSRSQRNLRR